MDNNKAFAIYACTLVGGIASVITASLLSGMAQLPDPLTFLEHVALSFTFRAAYKSFGGPWWAPYPSHAEEPTALPVPQTAGIAPAVDGDDLRDAA